MASAGQNDRDGWIRGWIMKMGTIVGVLAAAAAVLAIMASAPARAAEPAAARVAVAAPPVVAGRETGRRPGLGGLFAVSQVLVGVCALGAMLYAGREGMTRA